MVHALYLFGLYMYTYSRSYNHKVKLSIMDKLVICIVVVTPIGVVFRPKCLKITHFGVITTPHF